MLHSSWNGIALQEYPGEVALAISFSGCSLRCKGCHSPETHNPTHGTEFTATALHNLIKKHKHITAVVFYGGEWDYKASLLKLIYQAQTFGLKVCLYTGLELEEIPQTLLEPLDAIKVGPYIEDLGGLDSPTTNQKFITLKE